MVEFGLVALLFVLMLFGIVDFGMLLNGWINVSTGSAAGARWAALGNYMDTTSSPTVNGVYAQAKASAIVPGLSTSGVKVIATYTSSSGAYTTKNFCRGYYTTPPTASYTVQVNGASVACAGEPAGSNPPDSNTLSSLPTAGDSVQVTVIADKFEVITPLVRPFFGCSTTATHCYVPLTSSTTMRYEGSAV
jgi:Flp pilus assembly protein TadG